ncbi:MAG: alpha-amylase/4-alpha-glucanotransferase domain-containing protein, partial [bacterium]
YDYEFGITADQSASLWSLPLFTVSLSEGGFEKVQQGTLLLPQWQVSLQPGLSWTLQLKVSLGKSQEKVTAGSAASGQAHS